jgi:uncharacterized membrane-anchored protein YhcB (DUF1043 family)
MKTLGKIWAWVKAHWKWVVAGLAVVVALIVGARIAKGRVGPPPIPEKIQKRKEKVAFLQGEISQLEVQKTTIASREAATEEDIKKISTEISELDKKIADAREEVLRLSAEEKLKKFKELGY